MFRFKLFAVLIFGVFALLACFDSKPKGFVIADSTAYEASLFRQHCAICHGPEAEGKVLDDGTLVPSLREGEFKMKSESEIYNQISIGGHGMLPFRNQLTEREMRLLTDLVHRDLRGQ